MTKQELEEANKVLVADLDTANKTIIELNEKNEAAEAEAEILTTQVKELTEENTKLKESLEAESAVPNESAEETAPGVDAPQNHTAELAPMLKKYRFKDGVRPSGKLKIPHDPVNYKQHEDFIAGKGNSKKVFKLRFIGNLTDQDMDDLKTAGRLPRYVEEVGEAIDAQESGNKG